ncbi:transketolase [Lichenicoccus sp.]|uniref:transketolase n=1 Tax=Lichenicoccus sp. TaxID=2781899 RepID=UPI003D0DDDB1
MYQQVLEGAGTNVSAGDIDQVAINTIRTLAMDAVQKAKSGHPGTPMGMAPVGYTLWQHALRYDPADPHWPNRDRFVLSVGHASMLLYALLHLAQVASDKEHADKGPYAVTLDDIKQFRQHASVTPGHPEYRLTSGVETTTGPLGQGVSNSVGMAMAQRWLASRYNKPGFPLYDYHVYALAGDGCMMEGVSNEAASLAGHLKLGNLTWIYDSNHITIEGPTKLAFGDDVGARLAAMGWHVIHVNDANDTAAVAKALDDARAITDGPTIIVVHSIIGYGAPKKAGTREAHGEPLGEEEIRGAKRAYGWPEDSSFLVPDGVHQRFAEQMGARGAAARKAWMAMLGRYREQYPELAREIDMIDRHELPESWDSEIPEFPADAKGLASRDSSQKVLNAIAKQVPWLIGGAADLAPSTKSNLTFEGAGSFEADDYGGRNLHFGIREHVMGSACNGIALSGMRAYGSGFLIFSDYMKAPIRLSAIMELPVIYIFTHDSIGVGEDGPTHQPIEQLATLRAIPGMMTFRPADANEVAETWRVVMKLTHRPAVLSLSRQALPTIDRSKYASAKGVAKGAYIVADCDGTPAVILMATGSELSLCMGAYETLNAEGVKVRVVSMPSWELFEQQDQQYRDTVLPPSVKGRLAVEQAAMLGWDRYIGMGGGMIGMHSFGASAPLAALQKQFGFTPEAVLEEARKQAKRE